MLLLIPQILIHIIPIEIVWIDSNINSLLCQQGILNQIEKLDAEIVIACGPLIFAEVGQGDTVHIIVDGVIKAGPEWKGSAAAAAGAVIFWSFQADYRGQSSLCRSQNVAYCVRIRRFGKLIAALGAANTFDIAVLIK